MKRTLLFSLSLLSNCLFAQIQLSPLPLEKAGKIAQFDVSENGEPVVLNQKGELWLLNPERKIAGDLSLNNAPHARYGRVAAVDKKGNFFLWSAEKSYSSDIPISPNSGFQALAFATIAVAKQQGEARLVRIETDGNTAHISATADTPVLPDANPLQVNFDSPQQNQGHIAVLATPDRETYQHAVLGDEYEAKEIQYLERHTLKPLAESLSLNGLVFEANRLDTLNGSQPKLVSVMSGNGDGARTVLVDLADGKLQISAQSEPLPSNRWQSPFHFAGKLYAVQMPHLLGIFVEYTQSKGKLQERVIDEGLSNHAYGDYETNLAVSTENFALIPQKDYRSVAILNQQGKLEKVPTVLPAAISKTRGSKNKAYLLLENGQIWVAE